MTNAERIKAIVDTMKTDNTSYDDNALIIWIMLSSEEQEQLALISLINPPIYDGPVIKDPVRARLVQYGLVTRRTYQGNEGYTVITFQGYAVYMAGKKQNQKV